MKARSALFGLPSFLGILLLTMCSSVVALASNYKNFDVAIYIPVRIVNRFADPKVLDSEWAVISRQLKVDKVYIESTRGRVVADEALLETVKAFFASKGVRTAGGMTLEAGGQRMFESYCYTDPKDRAFVKEVTELTARHFDEIILDDFFFVTTKTPSDVAAKGARTWTQFRLDLMNEVAENLLLKPAKAVNPRLKFIIKYPNWYEHFQGLGFDLDKGPKLFDGIYAGTETREATATDQYLQPYQSYQIVRYFENIKPGANGGGWVDSFGLRHIDRYVEQLRDTMFAKAREMTLFCWPFMLQAVQPGERAAWETLPTSFDLKRVTKEQEATGHGLTLAGVVSDTMRQVDSILGELGTPIGIKSYKPHHSSGEDFLHNYFGMIGIPVDLYPEFPKGAPVVLLTESAKGDPQIVDRIKEQLNAGGKVVITSGLLRALQGRGLEQIIEAECTERRVDVSHYAIGPGGSPGVDNAQHPVRIPVVNYLTNDAWTLVRGETAGNGFPVLLMDRYTNGLLYVLTVPDNFSDLYSYPREVLDVLRGVLMQDFFVKLDAPSQVALFAYDNQRFIVESYLPKTSDIKITLPAGFTKLRNLVSGEIHLGKAIPMQDHRGEQAHTEFSLQVLPHSYLVFAAEK